MVKTAVIAHRGASRDAPENTIEAFCLAVTQDADMIETDLHLTRDGRIVLFHDAQIAGTDVSALTLAEVHERAPGIPTLEAALDAVGDRIPFNLEIKHRPGEEYAGIAAAALGVVGERGALARTLWSSFEAGALEALRREAPAARLGVLVGWEGRLGQGIERARQLGAEALHPHRSLVGPEVIGELQRGGARVNVYTVDDEADLVRLMDWGVDGIFTNVPATMRRLREERQRS
jgi:glycerophosphoryl diester phosphodiesterase